MTVLLALLYISAIFFVGAFLQTDLHCLFVISGRTIKFARGLESFTATIVGCGVPRVYLNRVGVVRDRRIDFPPSRGELGRDGRKRRRSAGESQLP